MTFDVLLAIQIPSADLVLTASELLLTRRRIRYS